jgi:hypothetical protein
MFNQIKGKAKLKSQLPIEEVAKIISHKFLGGVEFGDRDLQIYDNVPALLIDQLLGLRIILHEYGETNESEGYILSLQPLIYPRGVEKEYVRLHSYLAEVLKIVLKDEPGITVEKYDGTY